MSNKCGFLLKDGNDHSEFLKSFREKKGLLSANALTETFYCPIRIIVMVGAEVPSLAPTP